MFTYTLLVLTLTASCVTSYEAQISMSSPMSTAKQWQVTISDDWDVSHAFYLSLNTL